MLSGNGRHRRPRQAPAVFVTAGVTGAGIAMPLLGASGAQAADLDTWDKVAQCESGGLWSANTGNGYYGGLQLTPETWEQYGGTAYAERPDLASRGQQIAVAEKVLADRGPDAWPSCGVNAGLRHDTTGEAPAIDPGLLLPLEEAGTPEAPETPEGEERDVPAADGEAEGDGAEDSSTDTRPDGGDGAADAPETGADGRFDDGAEVTRDEESGGADRARDVAPEAGADSGEGTGRHRGERDPRELELERQRAGNGPEAERGTAQEERSADADDRVDRSARADFAGGLELGGAGESGGALPEHLVRPGDSLVSIAEEHEVRGGWSELYENNREVVGEDPDLILPGQELTLG